jgi:hypothetical protein
MPWAVVDRKTGRVKKDGLGFEAADRLRAELTARAKLPFLKRLFKKNVQLHPGRTQPKHSRRGFGQEYLSKAFLSRGKR